MSSTAVPGPVGAPRWRRLGWTKKEGWQSVPFLLPALLLLTFFLVWPVIWTVRLSFDTGSGLRLRKWVGLDNYDRLLKRDHRFLDLTNFPSLHFDLGAGGALVNNIRWVIVYTALCLVLGLLIAVLATRVRYEAVVKAIVFVPMAISATAVAIIWKFVYDPDKDVGVLNAVLNGGFGIDPISWIGRPDTVNYALIVAYVWASTGFVMVVLSAALKGISQEVIEAARTDGATEWDIFRRIQFPLLSLPIAVVTVWLVINVIKVFDIIYIMTSGGPGGASRVIAFSYYVETFQNGKGGYGAAVAVVMLILIIPIMALNIRRFRSERVIA
jgi:alpha-glucoside transport system permease protein